MIVPLPAHALDGRTAEELTAHAMAAPGRPGQKAFAMDPFGAVLMDLARMTAAIDARLGAVALRRRCRGARVHRSARPARGHVATP
ncbi:MAG: hypothetical protein ACHP9T_00380 [Caulobacterales bacterium]|jgi:hypothetical protein